MADPGHVRDGVVFPRQPFPRPPAILLGRGLEPGGRARQVIEDDVGHHEGETAMAQHRHLAIAVDRQMLGLLLHAVLEGDGAKGERQPGERTRSKGWLCYPRPTASSCARICRPWSAPKPCARPIKRSSPR